MLDGGMLDGTERVAGRVSVTRQLAHRRPWKEGNREERGDVRPLVLTTHHILLKLGGLFSRRKGREKSQ